MRGRKRHRKKARSKLYRSRWLGKVRVFTLVEFVRQHGNEYNPDALARLIEASSRQDVDA